MFYLLLVLLAGGIVALDQWTKALTVAADQAGSLPTDSFLGIFHITHTQNTGGAWGMLAGQTWLFVLVLVAFLALLVVMIWKKWVTKKFEWVCLAAIAGGGIGNMIDRLVHGFVTDMICFDFVNFPIFNVADCFITVGCFALLLYVLIFDRDSKQPEQGDSCEAAGGEAPSVEAAPTEEGASGEKDDDEASSEDTAS